MEKYAKRIKNNSDDVTSSILFSNNEVICNYIMKKFTHTLEIIDDNDQI